MIRNLPEDRLIERGLSAPIKELGPVETTRFLALRRASTPSNAIADGKRA